MNLENSLPGWVLLSSLVPAVLIFFIRERARALRTTLNLAAAVTKLVLVAAIANGVYRGRTFETRVPLLPEWDLVLQADSLSLLFVSLSAVLWLATTVYAIGYLEDSPHRSRFFGFFSLCVASTVGIAMAGNLLTFFFFYELLTLSTYPLVVHRGTREALRAGTIYLAYTLSGGVVLLAGIVLIYVLGGPAEFASQGAPLRAVVAERRTELVVAFVLLVGGLGVKTAIVPLHAWLPRAMVAPAPVSALLHAVAVVKAGAFGITRVVYDVFGIHLADELGVLQPLAYVAAFTILYGSLRALAQHDLKRRLAYSTVSQISFIVLGVAIYGTLATVGGLSHLVHQGLMKITLFFCAGNVAEELGVHDVRELRGSGRRMPFTMGAFTIAALGMIGLPPVAGFVTKWYLGLGSMAAGEPWVLGVLVASSALNAAYFLPIVYDAWFEEPASPFRPRRGRAELPLSLLLPTVATAGLALLTGLLAGLDVSPLGWVKLIAARRFTP